MTDEQRVLQIIREHNGKLDWQGLASEFGIATRAELDALQQAVNLLLRTRAFRLEFDEHGIVRFWSKEPEFKDLHAWPNRA
jgi:hypothetical protein